MLWLLLLAFLALLSLRREGMVVTLLTAATAAYLWLALAAARAWIGDWCAAGGSRCLSTRHVCAGRGTTMLFAVTRLHVDPVDCANAYRVLFIDELLRGIDASTPSFTQVALVAVFLWYILPALWTCRRGPVKQQQDKAPALAAARADVRLDANPPQVHVTNVILDPAPMTPPRRPRADDYDRVVDQAPVTDTAFKTALRIVLKRMDAMESRARPPTAAPLALPAAGK